MKQPDWAERKVLKIAGSRHGGLTIQEAILLLRAERRRAVRVCLREKVSGETNTEGDCAYNQACDDCAAAIEGK